MGERIINGLKQARDGEITVRIAPGPIIAGLAFIDTLDRREQRAFLGLFAGANRQWTVYDDDRAPSMGKAECEWVDDWRDFYGTRLKEAGLVYFEVGEHGPALGMVRKADDSFHTWTKIGCGPTQLGWAVREAWWARWNERLAVASAFDA